jgi:hypothetical protein
MLTNPRSKTINFIGFINYNRLYNKSYHLFLLREILFNLESVADFYVKALDVVVKIKLESVS